MGGEVIHLNLSSYLAGDQLDRLMSQPFAQRGQARNLPDNVLEIVVEDAGTTLPRLLEYCQQENITVTAAGEYVPPFDDIFVRLIERENNNKKEMPGA
jgi:hypothetical protein